VKDLSDCRILVVDDVKANVDVLVQALKDDYKLSVALDGESALKIVSRTSLDLILLDIMMPGIDGFEVCRQLRASKETREIPVMFLSSLEDVADKARGFEAGGNDYLTKPFEILEVKARVRSLVKAKAYADAVKEAMERDLRIAREIQMGILPQDLSPCTSGTGLDIHAMLEPAQQVGGDLYEALRIGERVVVALGDVSTKGIPASLFMAVTTTLLRSMARQFEAPDEVLRRVNSELAASNPRGMFVTLCCAVFDPPTGRVVCASAGHHAAVHLAPGTPPRLVFSSTGPVLGLIPGARYSSETLSLAPGETLVLFSDGVSEAFDAAENLFGEERLLEQLAREPGGTAAETVASILGAVRRHAAGAPQSDDVTIVAVRRRPDGADSSSSRR
jgi:serine phosphatase RsbU (regulator of sigma subunit)